MAKNSGRYTLYLRKLSTHNSSLVLLSVKVKTTLVPTKSGSDVMFCLQLLSKALT